MKKTLTTVFFIYLSSTLFAEVPNVYKSGDSLTAQSLNENFGALKSDITTLEAYDASQDTDILNLQSDVTALESNVNSLNSAISNLQTKDSNQDAEISNLQSGVGASYGMVRLYNSDNSLVGYLIGNLSASNSIEVITEKKYRFFLDSSFGNGGWYPHNTNAKYLFFESTDCTGQAYTSTGSLAPIISSGILFKSNASNDFDDTNPWFYIPTGEPITTSVTTNSEIQPHSDGTCSLNTRGEGPARLKAYPNDPNVTGFNGLSKPITLKFPFESN